MMEKSMVKQYSYLMNQIDRCSQRIKVEQDISMKIFWQNALCGFNARLNKLMDSVII